MKWKFKNPIVFQSLNVSAGLQYMPRSWRNRFPPPTVRVPGIKLRMSGLAVGVFNCGALSLIRIILSIISYVVTIIFNHFDFNLYARGLFFILEIWNVYKPQLEAENFLNMIMNTLVVFYKSMFIRKQSAHFHFWLKCSLWYFMGRLWGSPSVFASLLKLHFPFISESLPTWV